MWLGESKVSLSPSQLIQGFDTAEKHLGTEWVERQRTKGGSTVTGSIATLRVAIMGLRLYAVDKSVGFDELVARLQANDRAARTELAGAFLCIRGPSVERIEFEVPVAVGERTKIPDFRVTSDDTVWTNVEVTAPDRSADNAHKDKLITSIADQLLSLPYGASIELLLLRNPNSDELDGLVQRATTLAATMNFVTEDIQGLAIVMVNRLSPGEFAPPNYGKKFGPLLVSAAVASENGILKSVCVRMPVIDLRAENFLTSEARQLSSNEPGLIIIDMHSVPWGIGDWAPLLRRRLQPSIHTRVSGICLVKWGTRSTSDGEAVVPEVLLIENPHAVMPLPEWLREKLKSSSGAAVGK
jgi:hypothetical protein